MADRTLQGVGNFLKVVGSSAGKPTNLLTLALGIGGSVLFPAVSLPLLGASVIAVSAMTWADVSNDDYVKSVLAPSQSSLDQPSQLVDGAVILVDRALKDLTLFIEVREDLLTTRDTLTKIQDTVRRLPSEERATLAFAESYMVKLVQRILHLSQLEQRARLFLGQGDKAKQLAKLQTVQKQLSQATDSVVKKELELTESLLKEQYDLLLIVEKKLGRIESYSVRINATLQSSYAQVTQLLLKDKQELIDDAEVLNMSLKSMVDDIDTFEKQTIEISEAIETQKDKLTA